MKYELAYGKGKLAFTLPEGVKPVVIVPNEKPGLPDPLGAAFKAVAEPIGAPPLAEMLKKTRPKTVVVVLNDITRPTPYNVMLPPMLQAFAEAGLKDDQITFVVATGIHDGHTEEEKRELYGDHIVDRFKVVNHDAFAADTHVYMGKFKSGYDFYVNKLAREADFLITVGVVMPHYFAGYSGGRKSILDRKSVV